MAFVLMVGDSRVLRWREDRFKLNLPVSVHSLPSANLEKIQDRVRNVLCGHINPKLHLYPLQARPRPNKTSRTKKGPQRVKSSYEDCIDSFMSSLAQSNPQCARLENASKPIKVDILKSDCSPPHNVDIKAIVVFGFLYDFLIRTADATTKSGKGLTKAIPETCSQHYRTLLEKVASTTREWQERVPVDCKIIWTFPYPFDFLQYNNSFLAKVQQDPLSSREENSMKTSTKEFLYKLMVFRRIWLNLMTPDVTFFDLDFLDDSDGKFECNKVKCPRNVTPGLLFPSPRRVKSFNGFLNSLLQLDGPPCGNVIKAPTASAATMSS